MRKIAIAASVLCAAVIALASCGSAGGSGWRIVNRLSTGPSHEGQSGLLEVSFLTEKIGAAVNNGNYFFYTEDGGKNWRETRIETDPCLSIPSMADARTIAVGCQCNTVKISTDAGVTWKATDLTGFPKASMVDASTGFFAKNFAIKTIGSSAPGAAIDVAKPEGFGKIVAISAPSAECIAVMDSNGTLAVSGNSGQAWQVRKPIAIEGRTFAFGDLFSAIQFKNASEGIVVCFDSAAQEWLALSTADGGSSWKTESLLMSNFGYCSISRDLKFVTIAPMKGDSKIIVLKKMGA
jgi:photosystem II stability/assembly factor-like uncharacterized protein